MSLIDEALKRARQEAARQDEAAREQRYRQVPVIPGLRPRPRRNWLLPVVIVACLLAGLGLGLALSGRGGDDQRAAVPPPAAPPQPSTPVPQETPAAAAPEPVEAQAAPPVVVEEKPAPPPAPEPAAPPAKLAPTEEPAIADMRQREIELRPTREPEPPAPTAPAPAPVAQAPAPVPSPETAAPAPTAPAAATGQVRTYQQEMPLAGGGTLRLNGIAYSEQPVALFGDKVVAPGESVAGYKVLAIEAKRVRLEGQGGVVVLEMP
jgi:hypothetical protein